jgi:hypothetical protein
MGLEGIKGNEEADRLKQQQQQKGESPGQH